MSEGEDFVKQLFGAPKPDDPEPEPGAGESKPTDPAPEQQTPEQAHVDLMATYLGKPSEPSAEPPAKPAEPALDRTAIAKAHGLPERVADRLRGETAEELEADARELAEALGTSPAPEPPHVALARRALGVAESKRERDRRFLQALHPSDGWGEDS